MHGDSVPGPGTQRGGLWRPNLIAFLSSACIMVVELVAGRIIAPHVGASLYTWTGIIGIVLAGVSLGNYVGGRIADRWASLRLLGAVYLVASLSCLLILSADRMDSILLIDRLAASGLHVIVPIVLLSFVLFFLPCAALGAISPIVAKLAVRDIENAGRTIGRIYAAGAAGSIFGTFASGFWLVSWLNTHAIIWGVASLLALVGILLRIDPCRRGQTTV